MGWSIIILLFNIWISKEPIFDDENKYQNIVLSSGKRNE
jgi:uncharacterized protein YdaU (DUF1376 family)